MQDPLGDGINAQDLPDDVLNSVELAGADFNDIFNGFNEDTFESLDNTLAVKDYVL
jgi:hypothetical protein